MTLFLLTGSQVLVGSARQEQVLSVVPVYGTTSCLFGSRHKVILW